MEPWEDLLNDRFWSDVANINGYAVLMGHLSMSIKGLGFLVLTWTTVVLLGGFVSTLQRKDFWSLAFILLAQTAGIFDVALNEKLSYMMYSLEGLMGCIIVCAVGSDDDRWSRTRATLARLLLAVVLMLVQLVVLLTLLLPMAIIYVFGILISGGISLWRLIEQGYTTGGNSTSNTDSSGEAPSNMVPAMDTLYYLVLFQCVLFCYRFILGQSGKGFAKLVAPKCDGSQLELVSNYLHKTKRGCEKDPSFAKGRNLITHAVEMIGSNSPTDCISGVKTLYTTICISDRELALKEEERNLGDVSYAVRRNIARGQHMLIKHLILHSSSSTHILKKLLETLDSRGLHDRETRNQVAMIVERFAFNINLEKFPRGIQHITSMVETFEEYSIAEPYQRDLLFDEYEQHWKLRARCLQPSPAGSSDTSRRKLEKAYKELVLQGLCILRKLATDENNCRIMSDTQDLVSKIMAPIISDSGQYHATHDHDLWSQIVGESMKVIRQLAYAPGQTGAKLREEISSYQGAASTLWQILNCNECSEGQQLNAIWILKEVYIGTQSRREYFFRRLVDIFTQNNKSVSVRELAGRALLEVLCSHGGDTIVIQTGGGDVAGLTRVLLHDNTRACRQKAAQILEHLCTDYTKDDEFLGKLKKEMIAALPEVLAAIFRCGDETHNGNEDDQDEFGKQTTDIENQCDDTEENDEQEQHKEEKVFQAVVQSVRSTNLLSSLLSLCGTVYDKALISDFGPQLDTSSFLNKLKEVVVKKSVHPTVENLSLFKATGKMVISMMKHSGGMFVEQEELKRLIEALSSASENMMDLDHSMVFSSGFATKSPGLNKRTLGSIVKEAKELHATTSASG